MKTPTTRYECTISGCDWKHDQPDLGPEDISQTGSFAAGTYRLAVQMADVEAIIRAHFETHTTEEWAREVASLREELLAALSGAESSGPKPWVPMCTPCLLEAKQAQMRGVTPPDVHGAVVLANGMGLCEVRHGLQVGPPQIQVAHGMPTGGFGG